MLYKTAHLPSQPVQLQKFRFEPCLRVTDKIYIIVTSWTLRPYKFE